MTRPRTMTAEDEARIVSIGNGRFTGIADDQTLSAITSAMQELYAERAAHDSSEQTIRELQEKLQFANLHKVDAEDQLRVESDELRSQLARVYRERDDSISKLASQVQRLEGELAQARKKLGWLGEKISVLRNQRDAFWRELQRLTGGREIASPECVSSAQGGTPGQDDRELSASTLSHADGNSLPTSNTQAPAALASTEEFRPNDPSFDACEELCYCDPSKPCPYANLNLDPRLADPLGHGHEGLYGDDGEMQCNLGGCLIDFKREPLEDIVPAVLRQLHDKAERERKISNQLAAAIRSMYECMGPQCCECKQELDAALDQHAAARAPHTKP